MMNRSLLEIHDVCTQRLNEKKVRLDKYQKSFVHFVNEEITTSCFEKNAMNDLADMMQLKSEIMELENQIWLIKSQL